MHDLFRKHWYLLLLSKFNDSMLLTYFLNQSKDIWNKFKKSSKTGLSIISSMANSFQFLTLLPDFHFWKGDWALGCLRSILRLVISIQFWFICGERKLYKKSPKFFLNDWKISFCFFFLQKCMKTTKMGLALEEKNKILSQIKSFFYLTNCQCQICTWN